MNRKDTVTLDDILDQIMLQESEPNHQALTRWCQQYPQFSEALTRFFATWGIQEEQSDYPAIDEERVASKMVSHALNLLHSQAIAAQVPEQSAEDARLFKKIRASGVSDEALLNECNLDNSLLAKLDRHLIVFETIPQLCIQSLAMVLRCAVEEIARVLKGQPIPVRIYKAKAKPVLRQENFLDAVATSDLPDSNKQQWQSVASGEKPN